MFGLGKKSLVTLRVSAAAYDEIAGMLGVEDESVIDMSNICLTRGPEPTKPVHRPIAPTMKKNSAPGAI